MIAIEFEMDGFEEAANHLSSLADSLRGEVNAAATLAAAKAVETELMARTPLNTDAYTSGTDALAPGELLGDIGVRPVDIGASVAFAVGPGPETEHVANWVEYGHRMVKGGYSKVELKGGKQRVRGPGMVVDHVPAHPFIRPAQEASEADAHAAYEAVLKQAINK